MDSRDAATASQAPGPPACQPAPWVPWAHGFIFVFSCFSSSLVTLPPTAVNARSACLDDSRRPKPSNRIMFTRVYWFFLTLGVENHGFPLHKFLICRFGRPLFVLRVLTMYIYGCFGGHMHYNLKKTKKTLFFIVVAACSMPKAPNTIVFHCQPGGCPS